jgi:Clp amino terminal domain, pathogenicity island component
VDRLELREAVEWAQRRASSDAPLDQLSAAVEIAEDLRGISDQLIGHFVERARQAGSSWNDIGTSFGISRQAAHERFAAIAATPRASWPERFAPDAQAAMAHADAAMRHFRHHYLGTEHVLLGLLTARDNLAATALTRLGITEAIVRDAIAKIIGFGETSDGVCNGIAPRLKRALERARAEAKHSNHRYARGEHLLLAIAAGNGVASQILRQHDVDEQALRDQIADLLPEAPEIADAIRRGPHRRTRLRL